jgi:hypothetical protein
MIALDQHPSGRHFLQIPGPSPVPDRILRAISLPTIDHRGPEFAALGKKVLAGMREVFRTRHPVIIYPGSGTGAWEAALANVTSPGDRVLMVQTGHFATLWKKMALRLGLVPDFLALHFEMLAAHARRDLPGYYRLNARIHNLINAAARNPVLTQTYRTINARLQALRFRSNFDDTKWKRAVKEHDRMVDLLAAHDGAGLRALLVTHLLHKRDAVIELMREAADAQRKAKA